jgi:hypothetical protein
MFQLSTSNTASPSRNRMTCGLSCRMPVLLATRLLAGRASTTRITPTIRSSRGSSHSCRKPKPCMVLWHVPALNTMLVGWSDRNASTSSGLVRFTMRSRMGCLLSALRRSGYACGAEPDVAGAPILTRTLRDRGRVGDGGVR